MPTCVALFCGVRTGMARCASTPACSRARAGIKEEMESFLKILNRNEDWEIRYEIVPKTKAG